MPISLKHLLGKEMYMVIFKLKCIHCERHMDLSAITTPGIFAEIRNYVLKRTTEVNSSMFMGNNSIYFYIK